MAKRKGKPSKPPAVEAGASPLNGVVPPPEHRFPPGVSGNPGGSRSAGAYLTEWLNALQEKTEGELRQILRDPKAPMLKRSAAERILRTAMPALAAYEGLVSGTQTIGSLEAAGVDTALVKKVKERQEFNKVGDVVGVTRELELHNIAGEEFDRIADRTEGKPKQKLDVGGTLGVPTTVTMNVIGPKR